MTDPQQEIRHNINALQTITQDTMIAANGDQFQQAILFLIGEHLGMALGFTRGVDTSSDY